jgi:hypothetical protein
MKDDASMVTLPASLGQGYGRHHLSSGLLGPFVFLSVLGRYSIFFVNCISVLYLFVKIGSLESLLYICFL